MLQVLVKAFRLKAASLFILVYFVSAFVKTTFTGKGYADPVFSFVLFFGVFSLLMYRVTGGVKCEAKKVMHPRRESVVAVVYFICWLGLYMLLWQSVFRNVYFSNIVGFWGLLVLLPLVYLWRAGYRLPDFGLTTKDLGVHLRVAVVAGLLIGGVMLLLTPGGKYILSGTLPLSDLMVVLIAGFGLALLLAGFFEEFFFRAVLQTRLSAYFNSHFTGIVGASLLFGLYHLPFHFFGSGPSAGNLPFALANVFTEALITAPILGILWARTQNLLAPVFVHSLIDTISGAPRIAAMLNLH